MGEYCRNSYYALVWSTTLESKGHVKGELMSQSTRLPKDPGILYGTHNNDVIKVKSVEFKEELSYDSLTTKQSVKFNRVVEEYIIPRDVRIIVWEGSDTLDVSCDKYRIVSPQIFKDLVAMSKDSCTKTNNESLTEEVIWKAGSELEERLRDNVLNILNLELKFSQ